MTTPLVRAVSPRVVRASRASPRRFPPWRDDPAEAPLFAHPDGRAVQTCDVTAWNKEDARLLGLDPSEYFGNAWRVGGATDLLEAPHAAGGPTKVENAKIALVQFCISPPKTDMENSVVVSDYQQMDRILKEERNYIISLIKKIKASGCNVLLIQKSILRDAVTDLSLHYLAKVRPQNIPASRLTFFFVAA